MEKILKYSALIYAFLIFIGYSYVDSLYRSWDIQIYNYLDASEILLSFLGRFNVVMRVIIFAILFLMMILSLDKIYINNTNKPSIFSKIKPIYFLLILVMGLIILVFGKYFGVSLIFVYILTISMHCIIAIFCFTLIDVINSIFNLEGDSLIPEIAILIAVIVVINVASAKFENKSIEDKSYSTYVEFNYLGKHIISNDTLIYLGSTSNYIFCKNFKTKNNYIYEKSNVNNIIYRVNKKPFLY